MISFQKISNQLVLEGDAYIRQHGLSNFYEYAAKLLMNSEILEYFNLDEILRLAQTDRSTPQNFKSFEFSDLPLTISRGESCFIDLYFWRRRPTTIHNHHFSGAFMGLMGKNVDSEFSFSPSKKIGEFHELGELKLSREKIVGPGDVVAIAPLDGFIHQNHHQADLTVNLCFRTMDIKEESLSNFLYSGLRYTKDFQLLMRVERLKRLLGFGPIDQRSLDLDEAMGFYLQNYESGSSHPRFLSLMDSCHEKILSEAGLNLRDILERHLRKIEDLEDRYE